MGEKIAFENGWISDFQGLVTLTLTLDQVILHTVMHQSSTSTYTPNFIDIEQTFCGRTDGWADGHLRPTLLGRLGGVDLKSKNHARVIFHPFAGTPPLGRSVWILACWVILRRNHPCQILWQSVQGFRSSDTPNFALLHRISWSPLQQCKHCRATLLLTNWRLKAFCCHRCYGSCMYSFSVYSLIRWVAQYGQYEYLFHQRFK